MEPTTVYLPTTTRNEAEALARAVGLGRGPVLRRLIEHGIEAVGGDPVKLLLRSSPNTKPATKAEEFKKHAS